MKGVTVLLVTICLVVASFAFAGEQYLCTADSATGFAFNKSSNSWEQRTFKASAKYIISKPEDGTTAFVVREIGNSSPVAKCDNDFNKYGYLFCSGLGTDFRFNKDNGRYLSAYLLGYYNVLQGDIQKTDATSDTPYVEIGKCSPF